MEDRLFTIGMDVRGTTPEEFANRISPDEEVVDSHQERRDQTGVITAPDTRPTRLPRGTVTPAFG